MKESELTELVKDIERKDKCFCQIEVEKVIDGKAVSKKYGDLRKRAIKVIPLKDIECEEIKSDMEILKGRYNLRGDLEKLTSSIQNLNFSYHVLDNGIFLRTTALIDSPEGRGAKVADIIYERLK